MSPLRQRESPLPPLSGPSASSRRRPCARWRLAESATEQPIEMRHVAKAGGDVDDSAMRKTGIGKQRWASRAAQKRRAVWPKLKKKVLLVFSANELKGWHNFFVERNGCSLRVLLNSLSRLQLLLPSF